MPPGRIAILHYASPPTVGGVESTIAYHARGLADLGYSVRVVSGNGASFDTRIETCIDPLFSSLHPDVLKVKRALDAGQVTSEFHALVTEMSKRLRSALQDCEVCIAHNIHTLHKNLPLTAALAVPELVPGMRLIAWCHDLAWTNSQYRSELHEGEPWHLLHRAWPGVKYVTVSEARRGELAALFGASPDSISVVMPGIDPARFFHWTPTTERLVRHLQLLNADALLLLPARLTRRKNIELALRTLAECRKHSGRDYRLIVTGPPGPHNPANPGYLGELLTLRQNLGLDGSAHFLYAHGFSGQTLVPDDDTMANLYQLADALLFPSTQEGFGIPVLEAGLAGVPVFCADISALRHTGGEDAYYFDPFSGSPSNIGATIVAVLENSPVYRLRTRIRHKYRWDVLIRDRLVPLIDDNGSKTSA
jgi:glycosyltransferase involved in cell wall biosynthesis